MWGNVCNSYIIPTLLLHTIPIPNESTSMHLGSELVVSNEDQFPIWISVLGVLKFIHLILFFLFRFVTSQFLVWYKFVL